MPVRCYETTKNNELGHQHWWSLEECRFRWFLTTILWFRRKKWEWKVEEGLWAVMNQSNWNGYARAITRFEARRHFKFWNVGGMGIREKIQYEDVFRRLRISKIAIWYRLERVGWWRKLKPRTTFWVGVSSHILSKTVHVICTFCKSAGPTCEYECIWLFVLFARMLVLHASRNGERGVASLPTLKCINIIIIYDI